MTARCIGVTASRETKKVERMPDEERRVAQHVIVAAEEMVGDEGRLAVRKMAAELHVKRVAAVEVVVGQEEIRPPDLEREENER